MARIAGLLFVAVLSGCGQNATTNESRQALVERGRYLVVELGHCDGCHTPHLGPGQPDMSRSLQGRELGVRAEYRSLGDTVAGYAPALAGIPSHFTEEEFASFLQTGIRPDGSSPRPPMPRMRVSEEDARAIAGYVSSLPPAPDQ